MNKNILNKQLLLLAALCLNIILETDSFDLNQLDGLKAQFLPPEYWNTNFTVYDLQKIYREKCKKAFSEQENTMLYQKIEEAAVNVTTCITTLFNLTAIQEEMEIARPLGELDSVFHKHCDNVPKAESCVSTFNDIVHPCLSKNERKQNAVMFRIASSLLSFMCSRGGDQIALFIAEQGPECLEANRKAISSCMNASFAEYLPKQGSVPDVFNLSELILSPEHCIDFEHFEKCTLHHLEQCEEITPANVIESIFRFVKNETSCKDYIDGKSNQRPVLKSTVKNGTAGLVAIQISVAIWTLLSTLIIGQRQ